MRIRLCMILMLLCCILAGCNTDKSSMTLLSDEDFVSYIYREIKEPCEFLEQTECCEDYREYTFLLIDRDVIFTASQRITDTGLNMDNTWFWHNYKYSVDYSDYFNAIRLFLSDDIMNIAERRNINLDEYNVIRIYDISSDTLNQLYEFFMDVTALCDFRMLESDHHSCEYSIYFKSSDNEFVYLGSYSIIDFKKNYRSAKIFIDSISQIHSSYDQDSYLGLFLFIYEDNA